MQMTGTQQNQQKTAIIFHPGEQLPANNKHTIALWM